MPPPNPRGLRRQGRRGKDQHGRQCVHHAGQTGAASSAGRLRPGTLYDVVGGGSRLGSAIIEDRRGFGFIPAASGREALTATRGSTISLGSWKALHRAAGARDLLVLDTAAGIHREVAGLLRALSKVSSEWW